jgi:hypothetical protein
MPKGKIVVSFSHIKGPWGANTNLGHIGGCLLMEEKEGLHPLKF